MNGRRRRRPPVLAVALAMGVAVLSSACGFDRAGQAGEPAAVSVAAASDLRGAFEELGQDFAAETGIVVSFSFGSSGQLREQIVHGAPFDVFASADVAYVDDVVEAGRGVADTVAEYAHGRLALHAAPGRPLPAEVGDLADQRFRRIAVANPAHAPYGQAAVAALRSAGVYEEVEPRLVYGENISDTLRLARSGNADVAVVALSLVVTEPAPFTVVPDALHEPLRQALVVTAGHERRAEAERFARYVNSPAGREVLRRYGLTLPGEVLPVP